MYKKTIMEPTNQNEPEQPVETTEHETPHFVLDKFPRDESVFPIVIGKQPGFFSRFGKKKSAVLAIGLIVIVMGGSLTFAMLGTRNDTAINSEGKANTTSVGSSSKNDDAPTTSTEQPAPTSPDAPTSSTPQSTSPTAPPSGSGGNTSSGTGSSTPPSSTPPAVTSSTITMSYTNNCYSPLSPTIKRGDTIVFVNNSNREMWPASDNHPAHTTYSEFDSNRDISPGASYSFTFTKSGSWGYHDHSKPSCGGTITVQ